jgi:hypothetical protein
MAALFNGQAVRLAYLFEAHFADGTMIQQTAEDRSAIDPEKRSAFYDVMQRVDELQFFGLFNDQHTYVVDLRDGHFEVDGRPLFLEPTARPLPRGGKFSIVYFRDHEQDFEMSGRDGEQTMGEHRIAFRLGWEYEVAGKKYEQAIVIK